MGSARSLAERCEIRNNDLLRKKREGDEDYYNYKGEIFKRDTHKQAWIQDEGQAHNVTGGMERMRIRSDTMSTGRAGLNRAPLRRSKTLDPVRPKIEPDNELACKLKRMKSELKGGPRSGRRT